MNNVSDMNDIDGMSKQFNNMSPQQKTTNG